MAHTTLTRLSNRFNRATRAILIAIATVPVMPGLPPDVSEEKQGLREQWIRLRMKRDPLQCR
ncbi:MAG: hypothetical protein LUC93_07765 [Planctomycetaceae bacterium]|nr:hypothetical protein [Planctomycetaceae bacterium]